MAELRNAGWLDRRFSSVTWGLLSFRQILLAYATWASLCILFSEQLRGQSAPNRLNESTGNAESIRAHSESAQAESARVAEEHTPAADLESGFGPLFSDKKSVGPHKVPVHLASVGLGASSDTIIATPQVVGWLDQLIRRNLPPTYNDERKWGKQKEVWDGIEWRREGIKLETKRKWKTVNSGTWTRYAISIVEPDERLAIQFHRLEALPDGSISYHVSVDCTLDIFGRLSHWVRDVQLISLSANADAACRLDLQGTVQFQLNPLKLPPDVSLRPNVSHAHIDLTYYRVRRISQVGGDFAKHLGNGLRGVVDEKLEDLNAKLVDKINKQLAKHEDKLSFSTQDWLKSKLPSLAPAEQP